MIGNYGDEETRNSSDEIKPSLTTARDATIQIPLWDDQNSKNTNNSVKRRTGRNPMSDKEDWYEGQYDNVCNNGAHCENNGTALRPLEVSNPTSIRSTNSNKNKKRNKKRGEKDNTQPMPKYSVSQIPPWYLLIFLACQHALTLLGVLVVLPLLFVPLIGGTPKHAAELIGTTYFLTGLNTLIQTTFIGNRLPIVEVPSFSYLPPTMSIILHPKLQAIADPTERFEQTMQVLSGAILVAGILQTLLAYTGAIVPLLRFISPVAISCIITSIGLGYYDVAFAKVSTCFPMGLTMIVLGIVFSQMLRNARSSSSSSSNSTTALVARSGIAFLRQLQVLVSFLPLLTAIVSTWSFSALLTSWDVWEEGSLCRTDGTQSLIDEMPLLRIPYPGQWHGFRFEPYAIVPMAGALLASMTESVGDCYTCARVSGAPPPTPGIVCRGLAAEGLGVIMDGLFGKGVGSTSSSGDIAIMSITGGASRAVIQLAAVLLMTVGMFGKVAATLASLPPGIVGGMFCIVIGSLVAVGLSNLQFLRFRVHGVGDDRNLFIIGFALFNALSISGPNGYFSRLDENPFGESSMGQIACSLFSSPMVVALVIALFLDNTIPGCDKARGLQAWAQARTADINNDPEYTQAYALPWKWSSSLFRNFGYLENFGGTPPPPPRGEWPVGSGDLWQMFSPRRAA